MKSFITSVLFVLTINAVYGQSTCTPDSSYAGKSANIYPEAYHPRYNPDGGILDTACINHDYSFVFTVVVPDSFVTDYGKVKLDSIKIEENGFLFGPKGVDYKCNPPNCNFIAGTLGCIELYGKPETGNDIKIYDLEIKVEITALNGIIVINDTLPGFITDSAHYFLPLMGENSPYCQSLGTFDVDSDFRLDIFANPVKDVLACEVYVPESGMIDILLTDIEGRGLMSQNRRIGTGYNLLKLDISSLKDGMYFLTTIYRGKRFVKKIIVGN